MSLYTDIFAGVVTWTNRPTLIAETDAAIRQALRAAHRKGIFARDLVSLPLTNLPTDALQQIDLSTVAPDFKKVISVSVTGSSTTYQPIQADDLLDDYSYLKQDVYYLIGNYLNVRASVPSSELTLLYQKGPTVNPIANIDSWIADKHQDLIILWAASTVLTLVGEQEIKNRVDNLAQIAAADLVAEALELRG